MIDLILRPLIEHPKRHWIVITITLVFAIVFTWPAADVYFAASEKGQRLEEELREAQEVAGKLHVFEQQIEKKKAVLQTLEKNVLSPKRIEQFREELVDWVKESGCKLRRIKLADPQYRAWYEDDSPVDTRIRTDKDKKTPFKLRQQQLNMLVTGPLDKLTSFLAKLGEQEWILHTGNFQLRKSTEDATAVEMDMDLILFDLVDVEKTN